MQGIQATSENVEQIRERLRKMSVLELRKFASREVDGRPKEELRST
jgi:hypothetical protein